MVYKPESKNDTGVTGVTARETINLFATIGDMKDVAYKNTLGLTALIDLLIEKGVITKEELADRAQRLDTAAND